MGRLIDETNLMNLLYALDDARHELFYAIKKIPELPEVEAIPKAEYEARLKADLEAILIDMQLEIEEVSRGIGLEKVVDVIDVDMIIQQKINALKADTEGQDGQTSN